jgi:two-component system, sensor histidine kinase LadS
LKHFQTIKKIVFLLSIISFSLQANSINILDEDINILDKVEICLVADSISFEDIKNLACFKKNNTKDINFGFQKDKTAWIKFSVHNNSNKKVKKILEIKNPLLEEVFLYKENSKLEKKGMLHSELKKININHNFTLVLDANSTKKYYLKIFNHTTSLRFVIYLKETKDFLREDREQQNIIMIALGVILALLLYNLLLYFYSKQIAYLYYSLYLCTLIFQQLTYLGITPLYFSKDFVYIDNLSVLFKVNIMYIAAALFAKEFLHTKGYLKINKIYNLIILISLIEIPLFGTSYFYYPEIGILTGLVFVIFNIFAAIYIYKQGHKQARLFIAAWIVLVIGFVLMILDALGFISIMLSFQNIILYGTVLEALLLSLAFTDRYILLQKQKEKADQLLMRALENRQLIIEAEIKRQTKDLSNSLKNQKTLLKELHHRTKNNLQLMLSIIRMQAQGVENSLKNHFIDLENRVMAISKNHEMLYIQKNLQNIDMQQYLYELCEKIKQSFNLNNFLFQVNAENINLPLAQASYIALMINEIVINSIKHTQVDYTIISIDVKKKEGCYMINIKDNGKGKLQNIKKYASLGTSIIDTIIKEQLEGEYSIEENQGILYNIKFEL